jgi:hypothetical protein
MDLGNNITAWRLVTQTPYISISGCTGIDITTAQCTLMRQQCTAQKCRNLPGARRFERLWLLWRRVFIAPSSWGAVTAVTLLLCSKGEAPGHWSALLPRSVTTNCFMCRSPLRLSACCQYGWRPRSALCVKELLATPVHPSDIQCVTAEQCKWKREIRITKFPAQNVNWIKTYYCH